MHSRTWVGVLAVVCLLAPLRVGAFADDATLLRIFLTDGTSLVSYGELARVGDRVVFSMPTASTPNPPLHLVNISADRVDWSRTDRYAASARAAHYLETQADVDFAALSNQVAQALHAVTLTADPVRRIAIVEQARRNLADWPENHYRYRQAEVQQLLSLLDEAVADLRAAFGAQRFAVALFAFSDQPGTPEPMLPQPTPKETVEQLLTASHIVDSPAERTGLLSTAIDVLNRDARVLPAAWATWTRAHAKAKLRTESTIDRSYQLLANRTMGIAKQRARLADVLGLEVLIDRIRWRDETLGGQRAEMVNALIVAVQAELDAARQLQLARDRWALRAAAFRRYRLAIRPPMELLTTLKPSLESIKSLSGTSPGALSALQQTVDKILGDIAAIAPPTELLAAHALLVSATHLAQNAGQIRREATLAADIARAWDASSAAAGALMLTARARSDIQALLLPPQLQ